MKYVSRPLPAIQGLTLIELMVALAISAILLLGVATIYSASKRSYEVNDQFAMLQENARYALHRLTKEIRMAGYTGCKDIEETSITMIASTPPAELSNFNVNSYVTGHRYNGSAWSPNFDTPPAAIVTSADALTIRKASSCSATINAAAETAESALSIVRDNCGFKENEILLITDCQSADMFTKTNGTSSSTIAHSDVGNKNTKNSLSKAFDNSAHVMRAEAITYYIGTDTTGNKHLYMQSLQAYDGEYQNVVNQLIPNVEDMAIEYGIDTNGDESIDDIQNAQQVETNANWDKVLSVYLRLLFYTDNVGNSSKPYSFNGVTHDGVSQPLPGDRRFRREFVTTINLRNRIHYN